MYTSTQNSRLQAGLQQVAALDKNAIVWTIEQHLRYFKVKVKSG